MRWPKGPPHLALNPPYFVFVLFLLFFCFFFVFFCFGLFLLDGLRSGEVAQRATSLGPKPSLFIYFFWLFWFPCLCFC